MKEELKDKIQNAKTTNWVTKGFTQTQVKRIVILARIKAKIQLWFLD